MAFRDGAPIAGALNFIGRDALYGRQWGALEEVPFLHFELCYYQAIEFAISRGLSRVEAGAQGEHKIARGYLPSPVYSAHFIADPALRDAGGALSGPGAGRGGSRDRGDDGGAVALPIILIAMHRSRGSYRLIPISAPGASMSRLLILWPRPP